MGYQTYYKIKIVDGALEPLETEMIARGYTSLEKFISREILGDDNFNLFIESTKWYDHDIDMKRFSKKHPNATFELSGDGEEQGDVWKAYYKNGKMKLIKPELFWPDFDESMLE